MKAFIQVVGVISYLALGLIQWTAQVDGLKAALHWPTFICWFVSTITSWFPLVGTAAGVWGAHAGRGWNWLPSLALFLGIPLAFVLLGAVVLIGGALHAALQRRRLRA